MTTLKKFFWAEANSPAVRARGVALISVLVSVAVQVLAAKG